MKLQAERMIKSYIQSLKLRSYRGIDTFGRHIGRHLEYLYLPKHANMASFGF